MPPRAQTIVDPRFGAELRRWRETRNMSLRQLAAAVSYGKSLIHQLETGQTRPTVDMAVRLDDALHAGGTLAALVANAPDGGDRTVYAAEYPRRVDLAAVHALSELLSGYRRLEDSIGTMPVLPPVRAQLDTIVSLLREAPHQVRPTLVNVAAQWAQFAGWLGIATGNDRAARTWLGRGLQWATEAGSVDLIAAILSFQGYQAEGRGDLPEAAPGRRAGRGSQYRGRRHPAPPATLQAAAQHGIAETFDSESWRQDVNQQSASLHGWGRSSNKACRRSFRFPEPAGWN